MSSIDREVHIAAPPADVEAHLRHSRWIAGFVLTPEGIGTRVRISAEASPSPVAASLEVAMLADVCRAKAVLEGGEVDDGPGDDLADQPLRVGKSM